MVLKELEIQGFKSFPDRTKIQIDRGITAVVGPNGSGKSNISDAIRWVLGETSSKQLRGAGKMEDVIFGGTQQRGAMGYASVKLTVDNADRRIDVDADTVVIGRKYYRSGESEYSINGQNVRLKDIYELFLDTGLGRDGYSAIGQGRIAEIVGAKSAERREIFEEASGIAKYRYRKNEAQRRLAAAEENLERLRDILDELESRVVPLEQESKKAQEFLKLSAKRKELEVTLWVDTVRRARDTVREQQRKYETAEADYNALSEEIEKIDEETEAVRQRMQQLGLAVERGNAAIRSITEEMAGADSRMAVLENDIRHNRISIQSFQSQLRQEDQGSTELDRQITENQQAARELEITIAQLDEKTQTLETRLARLQKESAASGQRKGELTGELSDMTRRQTEARVKAAGCESAAATASQRLSAVHTALAQSEEKLAALREEKQDTRQYLRSIEDEVTRLNNIKNGLALKMQSRQQQQKEADEAHSQAQRQLDAARQRVHMLKELEKNMDGYQQSVKTVMRAAQNRRLAGIIGPVSSILTVEPGYETAIETALGYAMQNIVVNGENAAKAAIAFLKQERAGRATFLPLDTMTGSHMDASRLSGSARVASSLVRYESRYDRVVANLLGRIIVVDDLDEASRVARSLGYRNRIVTVDGQVINAGGSFTGGSSSRSAGLFSRRQEIEELTVKLKGLSDAQEKALAAADDCRREMEALKAEITATESEVITAGGDKIRAEMEYNRLVTALDQAQAAADALEEEAAGLEKSLASTRTEGEEAKSLDEQLAKAIAQLEEELALLSGSDDSFLAGRAALSEQLSGLRLDRLAAEKDRAMHLSNVTSLENRQSESGLRSDELKANIRRLEEANRQGQAEIEATAAQKQQAAQRVREKEEEIKAASETRMELEGSISRQSQEIRNITDQREKMSGEMARLAERKAAAEIEYDQSTAKLWEEYQLTMSDAQQLCVEFESVTELRRQVAEVRSRIRSLGNVNVGAIEEYQEVSQRYEFLSAQVADVENSKKELGRMISELSGQMRELFSASFAQINTHFARIFNELFGGGTAALSLEDPDNVLESGIDIRVAPPGKVIKNLTALSGGEQALVAISIYFAILAVNPAPFCILDEIEAALDDVNVTRYAQYLGRISDKTQFIVITHRRGTMEAADVLYGVTMQQDGVSKLLRLDLNEVDAELVN